MKDVSYAQMESMSYIPFKGDIEAIMARFESTIQELK
jgi:hypothetical protein